MNLKRFTARTSRDALALVREAFGDDAVVMSTRPCPEGVEVLAMAPESVQQLERVRQGSARHVPAAAAAARPGAGRAAPAAPRAAPATAAARGGFERVEPTFDDEEPTPSRFAAYQDEVRQDVNRMHMSTLSFQEYVRERMLKRRQAELAAAAPAAPSEPPALSPTVSPIDQARTRLAARQAERQAQRPQPLSAAQPTPHVPTAAAGLPPLSPELAALQAGLPRSPVAAATPASMPAAAPVAPAATGRRDPLTLRDPHAPQAVAPAPAAVPATVPAASAAADTRAEQIAMISELRSMRGLIEQRFGALAFMDKLQRHPRQAQLTQRLLDAGFSPALTRRLVEGLPAEVDEAAWAAGVLERNLLTGERESALEDAGGVYAFIGATGVGKTTSTAKLAAAFAARHGAANLGLITLDAYRIAAHEQLRTYGRILGVPVHTAHDRASLDDLLELLAGKRMVLIDTAGMSQRDERARELLQMLGHASINRLVVINAAAQGETIEDQLSAYAGSGCRGVVLSKVDEAVKLGPALDAMIRARLKVLAVANGQRVPEDWHRLSAQALVQRALRCQGGPAWRLEPGEVNLVFAGVPPAVAGELAARAGLGTGAPLAR